MMTKQKQLLIAACAAVLLAGGGWFFAKHKATSFAKDQVDGYIIRHNLGGKVTYEDLSASPFGTATLSGVRLRLSPTSSLNVASLQISDVEMKYDQIRSISVSARGVQVPFLALAKEDRRTNTLEQDLIGMGYTTLNGDLSASVRYDDQRGTLDFSTTGDVQDAGSWKAKVSLANVDPGMINAAYSLANGLKAMDGFTMLAVASQGLQGLSSLALAVGDVSIDNSGIYKRHQQVTDQDIPPDMTSELFSPSAKGEEEMVKAGMAPSEARATREAVDAWMKKGGTLKIATNLNQPLPLFRSGKAFTPAFDDVFDFLVSAKVRVSN